MPSPTISTLAPRCFSSSIRAILSAGVTPARHSGMSSALAAAFTAASRSPERISMPMLRAFSAAITAFASGRRP